MLLSFLPPKWSSFVTIQETIANITLPTLLGRILQEDTIRQNVGQSSSGSSPNTPLVLYAKGSLSSSPSFRRKDISWKDRASPRSQSPTIPYSWDIVCTYCSKKGHYCEDCWNMHMTIKKHDNMKRIKNTLLKERGKTLVVTRNFLAYTTKCLCLFLGLERYVVMCGWVEMVIGAIFVCKASWKIPIRNYKTNSQSLKTFQI